MNVSLFRYAFVLILLSLIGGFFIPAMAIPRLGLSAHTIGTLSGILLIAVGAIWQHFQLSSAAQQIGYERRSQAKTSPLPPKS